jgi:hypothetical protein
MADCCSFKNRRIALGIAGYQMGLISIQARSRINTVLSSVDSPTPMEKLVDRSTYGFRYVGQLHRIDRCSQRKSKLKHQVDDRRCSFNKTARTFSAAATQALLSIPVSAQERQSSRVIGRDPARSQQSRSIRSGAGVKPVPL